LIPLTASRASSAARAKEFEMNILQKSMRNLAIGAAAMAAATAAWAHHGWGDYDDSKAMTLEGTVLESAYENPHTVIKLKTANKTWVAVLAPPFRMEARQRDLIVLM
jgi:hypothetical protein